MALIFVDIPPKMSMKNSPSIDLHRGWIYWSPRKWQNLLNFLQGVYSIQKLHHSNGQDSKYISKYFYHQTVISCPTLDNTPFRVKKPSPEIVYLQIWNMCTSLPQTLLESNIFQPCTSVHVAREGFPFPVVHWESMTWCFGAGHPNHPRKDQPGWTDQSGRSPPSPVLGDMGFLVWLFTCWERVGIIPLLPPDPLQSFIHFSKVPIC